MTGKIQRVRMRLSRKCREHLRVLEQPCVWEGQGGANLSGRCLGVNGQGDSLKMFSVANGFFRPGSGLLECACVSRGNYAFDFWQQRRRVSFGWLSGRIPCATGNDLLFCMPTTPPILPSRSTTAPRRYPRVRRGPGRLCEQVRGSDHREWQSVRGDAEDWMSSGSLVPGGPNLYLSKSLLHFPPSNRRTGQESHRIDK
jgi:hypothetical protein